jgi:hypothetical protein
VAFRKCWCELLQADQKRWSGNFYFRKVGGITCDVDPDGGGGLRAALILAVRQHGLDESDLTQYQMNVFDVQYGELLTPSYAIPPDPAGHPAPVSLAEYTDDQLISELARRLRQRQR